MANEIRLNTLGSISFALAVGQFVWGLSQPIFGAIADRKGSYGVAIIGAFIFAGGLALTPLAAGMFPTAIIPSICLNRSFFIIIKRVLRLGCKIEEHMK